MKTKKIDLRTKKGIVIESVLPKMPVEERLFLTGDYSREGGMGTVEEVYDDNLKRCLVRIRTSCRFTSWVWTTRGGCSLR
jgi:hypothetical protein